MLRPYVYTGMTPLMAKPSGRAYTRKAVHKYHTHIY